jgi:hypothetical protein
MAGFDSEKLASKPNSCKKRRLPHGRSGGPQRLEKVTAFSL